MIHPASTTILRRIDYLNKQIAYYTNHINKLNIQKTAKLQTILDAIEIEKTKVYKFRLERLYKLLTHFTTMYDKRIQYFTSFITKLQADKNKLNDVLTNNPSPVDTTNPVPDVSNPPSASTAELVDITKTVHDAMMLYMKNNWQFGENENNFIIPYIPKNMNFRLEAYVPASSHQGAEDWKQCLYPTLGNSKLSNAGIRLGWQNVTNTYLEIYGYFTTLNDSNNFNQNLLNLSTNSNSILSKGLFVAKQIYIPPTGILTNDQKNISLSYPIDTVYLSNYLNGVLGTYLDSTAINVIDKTITALTRWARDTGFLVPLPFCTERSWYQTYGEPILNPSIPLQQSPISGVNQSFCPNVVDLVCDPIYNKTYKNECEAKKAGVVNSIRGACFNMVGGRDFGNISSIAQMPTEATDDSGQKLKDSNNSTITLPNVLQAEYFRRLYAFVSKNRTKVSNLNQLASWCINYLQTYNTYPT